MRKLTFVVGAEDDGRLIKRVVRGRMGISHRGFSDIKNQHAMLVDGRPVLANYCVHAGEIITLYLPEDPPPQPMELDDTPIEVAYEDQDILIVNKPAPLASHQPGVRRRPFPCCWPACPPCGRPPAWPLWRRRERNTLPPSLTA